MPSKAFNRWMGDLQTYLDGSPEYRHRHQTDKVLTLFWTLIGQAAVAFPEEVDLLWKKHYDRDDMQPERDLADFVEKVARLYPVQGLTHL